MQKKNNPRKKINKKVKWTKSNQQIMTEIKGKNIIQRNKKITRNKNKAMKEKQKQNLISK